MKVIALMVGIFSLLQIVKPTLAQLLWFYFAVFSAMFSVAMVRIWLERRL